MWARQRVDIVSFGETYMPQLGVELDFLAIFLSCPVQTMSVSMTVDNPALLPGGRSSRDGDDCSLYGSMRFLER